MAQPLTPSILHYVSKPFTKFVSLNSEKKRNTFICKDLFLEYERKKQNYESNFSFTKNIYLNVKKYLNLIACSLTNH